MPADPNEPLGSRKKLAIFIAAVLAIALPCLPGCGPAAEPEAKPDAKPDAAAPEDADTDDDSATTDDDSATTDDDSATTDPGESIHVASAESAALGKQLYAQHCATCHGESGDGQGVAAAFVFPKPRDFRAGRFRLASTSNRVPTRADLHAVLLRGMPGSSMPPWSHLSNEEREALVDEIMRLRRVGAREAYVAILKEEDELTDEELAEEEVQQDIDDYVTRFSTPGDSTEVPEFPLASDEALARGKEVYTTKGCVQCHGKEGKGDTVQKMFDDEKLPTVARDFTVGIFKGGDDPASLYRRIAYGMPGTPMPSSSEMTPEQMTDLVHYVLSMSTQEQRSAVVLNREKIVAARASALPEGPGADAWTGAQQVSLRMTPLWWRNDADPDLQVQALHDGTTLAVRISWEDATEDGHAARSESFEDGVAMELYAGDAEPFIGMGDPNSPIDVWFWDADRQGEPLTVEQMYPNTVVDLFPFSEELVASAELDRDGARTADQPDISLPARAVGNPIVPSNDPSGASTLTAGGPGSATFRIPKSPLVLAHGEWSQNRWSVVMTRQLAVESPEEGVAIAPGGKASVAFAVWDGSHQDRDGKKLITIWQDLELEP